MNRVGVVVLSYEGADLTLDCLASLAADDYADRIEIVVDNGSADSVLSRVAELYPGTVRIRMDRNLGFSAGNNAGMAKALDLGCDHVLILNNDTLVECGAVGAMVAAARPRRVVAPLIVYAEAPDIAWYAGARFDPRTGMPGRMEGYGRQLRDVDLAPRPTQRFSGAAVMVPAVAVREVGMFDDDLFFLFEDVEWSLRLRRAGYQIHFEPSARIRHRVARTQGGEHSLSSYYYGTRNQLAVSQALCPLSGLAAGRRAATVLGVYLARARRAPRPVAAATASLEGFRDWRRGRSGQWSRQPSAAR
ncbi:MAG TPA: glycosyltransferase family 2 protein [Solirubrobacteraceae bacterium]